MWIAFGNLGHWSEWSISAPTLQALLYAAEQPLRYYGEGFIAAPERGREWHAVVKDGRVRLKPYTPLLEIPGEVAP